MYYQYAWRGEVRFINSFHGEVKFFIISRAGEVK